MRLLAWNFYEHTRTSNKQTEPACMHRTTFHYVNCLLNSTGLLKDAFKHSLKPLYSTCSPSCKLHTVVAQVSKKKQLAGHLRSVLIYDEIWGWSVGWGRIGWDGQSFLIGTPWSTEQHFSGAAEQEVCLPMTVHVRDKTVLAQGVPVLWHKCVGCTSCWLGACRNRELMGPLLIKLLSNDLWKQNFTPLGWLNVKL